MDTFEDKFPQNMIQSVVFLSNGDRCCFRSLQIFIKKTGRPEPVKIVGDGWFFPTDGCNGNISLIGRSHGEKLLQRMRIVHLSFEGIWKASVSPHHDGPDDPNDPDGYLYVEFREPEDGLKWLKEFQLSS